MVSPRYCCYHRRDHPVHGVDHLLIAEPEAAVSGHAQHEITATVCGPTLGCVVKRAAIDLDDQPLTDEEVNPSDAGDGDLSPERRHEVTKRQPEQGLCATRANAVNTVGPCRMPGSPERVAQERILMKRRVECGQVPGFGNAASVVGECVGHPGNESGALGAAACVVHDCSVVGGLTPPPAVALVAKAGIFVIHPDVNGRMLGCPHSVVPQRVAAGERATNAKGPENQRVSAGPHEPSLSRAPHHAVVEKFLAGAAAHTSLYELVGGEHPPSGIDQSQDLALVHGSIVALV